MEQQASTQCNTWSSGETTKLEWVVDSDFRFFPTARDETFGYVLHPIDLAANKVGAAYDRREPRDAVDLLTIDAFVAQMPTDKVGLLFERRQGCAA